MNDIDQAREDIKQLENREKQEREERARPHKQLRDARNRLAFLSASMYVVVDCCDLNHDRQIELYGVSAETTSGHEHGLTFRIETSAVHRGLIRISSSGWHGTRITVHLEEGGHAFFTVDDRADTITHQYCVFAFKDKAEAQTLKGRLVAERDRDLEEFLRHQ